jgi:hypothetical protein
MTLADIQTGQGNYTDAEPLYQRALEVRERVLGADHPDVATTLTSYARLLRKMGRAEEAGKLEARVRAIRTKARLAMAN